MKKLRLSYTKLNAWVNWDYNDTLLMLQGIPVEFTESQLEKIKLGDRVHKRIENERLNLLGLDGDLKYEYKNVVRPESWLEVSFIVDVWAGDTIVDWKTGGGDPIQLYLYALFMQMHGHDINYGYLQPVDEVDGKIVLSSKPYRRKITQEHKSMAYSWMIETAWWIRNYLEAHPLALDSKKNLGLWEGALDNPQ